MFDVGFSELVLIALVGLIVLGPKRLPEAAREIGRWVGRMRRFVANVKSDLDRELNADELKELRSLKTELESARKALEDSARDTANDASRALSPPEPAASDPATEKRDG